MRFVLDLQQQLMEGNYQTVIQQTKGDIPYFFSLFLSRIDETIRFEIARSAEKAYKSLSLRDALAIFQLSSVEDLNAFVLKEQNNA